MEWWFQWAFSIRPWMYVYDRWFDDRNVTRISQMKKFRHFKGLNLAMEAIHIHEDVRCCLPPPGYISVWRRRPNDWKVAKCRENFHWSRKWLLKHWNFFIVFILLLYRKNNPPRFSSGFIDEYEKVILLINHLYPQIEGESRYKLSYLSSCVR